MELPFIYDTYVTGKRFIGRREDVQRLINLIRSSESVAVYGEPGCGKMSLVRESLTQAHMDGMKLCIAQVDLMRARKTEDVLVAFASGVLKAFCPSPEECRKAVGHHLAGTHLVFDREQYDLHGEAVSTNWLIDEIDVQKVFALGAELADERFSTDNQTTDTFAANPATAPKLIVLVSQFQNISCAAEEHMLLTQLEKAVEHSGRNCCFIFTGSHMNAMRNIFDVKRWFWRSVERLAITQIAPTQMADYIYRVFQNQGKVLDKDLVINASQLLRCNPRYVNHLFSIVDSTARGYVNKGDVDAAMRILVSIHRPRFFSTVCSLTDFQLSLLRAIMAGEVRFSSSAIIDRYQLNSSANVNRLKDALVKKEVVWFDEKDEPHVCDPLFEYWLAHEYFAI